MYTIPIFRGSRGVAGQALKGWEVSGIPSTYTGVPSTVTTPSVDPAGLGILGSSAASSRAPTSRRSTPVRRRAARRA
ncbi:MAG TPA: hypothetical protein VE959_28765 [Bryobacteraceae bacterium]|nr:hypothetical protein [Bryobacteraceae bacterium]